MQLLINIDVPDLAAAESLYCRAFGFEVGRRFGGGMLELLGAAAPIYLLQATAGSIGAAASARDYRRHWTPVHLDLVVDHLETALAQAPAAGRRHAAGKRSPRRQLGPDREPSRRLRSRLVPGSVPSARLRRNIGLKIST